MDPFLLFVVIFCCFGSMAFFTIAAVGLTARKNWEKYGNNMKGFVVVVIGLLTIITAISYGAAAALAYIWRYLI